MPNIDVPLRQREPVDVLVAGGGPAGLAAALAAAEEGARVLLVEQTNCLGGAATSMLVPCFCPFTTGGKPATGGIGLSILQDMKARMGDDSDRLNWVPIDPEVLKVLCDERAAQAGVEVLLQTFLADVISAEGRVQSAIIANKSGLQAVPARVFVDGTGDGDLSVRAGAQYQQGDAEDVVMGCTLCFILTNVSRARFTQYLKDSGDGGQIPQAIARAKSAGDLDIIEPCTAALVWPYEHTAGLNFGHVYPPDPANPEHLTAATVEGRALVQTLVNFMRQYVPGFEHAHLAATAPLLGIRETRRIVGDYVVTLDDYLACRSFDDDVARNAYFIDIHPGRTTTATREGGTVHEGHRLAPGESHGIPYRALTPRGLSNVLVAGRCLSTDRVVQGSIRVMPPAFATGEAAGVAAALARELDDVRQVHLEDLQGRLRARGARIDA